MKLEKRAYKSALLSGYGVIILPKIDPSFVKYGYEVPKYKLPLFNSTVFYWAIRAVFPYYSRGYKIFFILDDTTTDEVFINQHIRDLQVTNYEIIKTSSTKIVDIINEIKFKISELDLPIFFHNIDFVINAESLEKVYTFQKDSIYESLILKNSEFDKELGFYWFKSLDLLQRYVSSKTLFGKLLKPRDQDLSSIFNSIKSANINIFEFEIDSKDNQSLESPDNYQSLLD